MAWGWMIGAGEALQSVGKDMLAANLEKQREARAEQREQRKEQRAQDRLASTPDPSQRRFIQKDGAWMEQTNNAFGTPLEEKLANQADIDRLNREAEKEKASIAADLARADQARISGIDEVARAELLQKQIEAFDSKNSLQLEEIQSRINKNNRTGSGKGGGIAGSFDDGYTDEELATVLVKENKDIIGQYKEAGLTPDDARRIAVSTLKATNKSGNDPMRIYRDALSRWAEAKKKAGSTK